MDTRVQQFEQAWDKITIADSNGWDYHRSIGDCHIHLVFHKDHVELSSLFVRVDDRRQKAGSIAMMIICGLADMFGVTVMLEAGGGKTFSTTKLIEWYQSYGFEVTNKYSKQMTRYPQQYVEMQEAA